MFSNWIAFHEKHELLKKALDKCLKEYHTNLNTYTVCYILREAKAQELRISDLAARLSLSNSATSRLIAKLEEETGFIRREMCPIDNRGLYAVLTDKGSLFLDEVAGKVEATVEAYL